MLKKSLDTIAKKKARELMLNAAKNGGFDVESRMTKNIDAKLDDLMQAIIDDIGYTELTRMGLKL